MWIYRTIWTKLDDNVHSEIFLIFKNVQKSLKFKKTNTKNGVQHRVKQPKIIPNTKHYFIFYHYISFYPPLTPLRSFAALIALGFVCRLFRMFNSFLNKKDFKTLIIFKKKIKIWQFWIDLLTVLPLFVPSHLLIGWHFVGWQFCQFGGRPCGSNIRWNCTVPSHFYGAICAVFVFVAAFCSILAFSGTKLLFHWNIILI